MQLIDIFTSKNLQEISYFYLDSNFFGIATNSTILAYLLCSTLSFNKYSKNIFKMRNHYIIILSLFINLYYCIKAETFYNLFISVILIIFIIPLPYKGYRKILFNILTLNLNPKNFLKKIYNYKLNLKIISIYTFIFFILVFCISWTYFLFKNFELTGSLFLRAKLLIILSKFEYATPINLIIVNGLDSFRYIYGKFSHNIFGIFQFELGLLISFYFLYVFIKEISSYKFSLPIILYSLFFIFTGIFYIAYPSYQYLLMGVCILKSTRQLENNLR